MPDSVSQPAEEEPETCEAKLKAEGHPIRGQPDSEGVGPAQPAWVSRAKEKFLCLPSGLRLFKF